MKDLRAYLVASSTKTSFGNENDWLLAKLPAEEKRKKIKSFQEVLGYLFKSLKATWNPTLLTSTTKQLKYSTPATANC